MTMHDRGLRLANDWIALGNTLYRSHDEASRRTAVSRTYYGLLMRARVVLMPDDLSNDRKIHKQIGTMYRNRFDAECSKGMGAFRILHQSRVHADYTLEKEFTSDDAAEAIELSLEIDEKLRGIIDEH